MLSECSLDDDQRLRWRDRIWVPHYEPLRTQIIQAMHNSTLSGHPGRDTLKALISRTFYWPGLSQDVRRFVKNCDVCGRVNIWREKKRGLLKPLPIPQRIWAEISLDFVTDLPPTRSKNLTNLLVITDRLSKNVILEPIKDITSESTAIMLVTGLIRHHGLSRAIVSDRGTQFVSQMWKRLCQLCGIKQRLSTAYHPETDGATERANQVVETYLRAFCAYTQDNWDELSPVAMIAINNRPAASTGISPFFFSHGYDMDLIRVKETLRTEGNTPIAKAESLVQRIKDATDWAQAAIAVAQERQERYANARRQPSDQFKPGDKVWLRLTNIKTDRPSKKLDWTCAKYTVLETVGSHSCRLDTPPGIHNVFHVSLLKHVGEDPFPSQQQDDIQPAALQPGPDEEYEVQEILRKKRKGRGWQVLVKWKGYAKPTWEPLRNLEDTAAWATFERQNAPAHSEGRRGVL